MLRLQKLLKAGNRGGLEKIVQRAQDMGDLTHRLKRALPPELADELKAANVREDGELVILCHSSAWAARLRFESETLLRAASDAGAKVSRCRVRVGGG